MRIALALGSGGARGYVHIGLIGELHDRGHEITAIAGTSMGALVGGLEAAGKLGEYEEWVRTLTQRDVIRLLDPALTGPGAFWGQRVMERVAGILGGAVIENLPIPFTAVATDLTHRREVWFQRGSVATATRASIGIPWLFTPVMLNGQLLSDGGLLNPVPVDPLLGAPADRTIAVSLAGRRQSIHPPERVSAEQVSLLGDLTERLRGVWPSDAMRGLWSRFGGRGEQEPPADDAIVEAGVPADLDFDELPRGLRSMDVVSASLETMEALVTRVRLAVAPPDLHLEFPHDLASTWDFHRANELIDLGRTRAAAALDEAGL